MKDEMIDRMDGIMCGHSMLSALCVLNFPYLFHYDWGETPNTYRKQMRY